MKLIARLGYDGQILGDGPDPRRFTNALLDANSFGIAQASDPHSFSPQPIKMKTFQKLTLMISLGLSAGAAPAQSITQALDLFKAIQKQAQQRPSKERPAPAQSEPDAPASEPTRSSPVEGGSASRATTPTAAPVASTGDRCALEVRSKGGSVRLVATRLAGGIPADGLNQFQVSYYRGKNIPFHWDVRYEYRYAGSKPFFETSVNEYATAAGPRVGKGIRVLSDMTGRKPRFAQSEPAPGRLIFVFPEGTATPDVLSIKLTLRATGYDKARVPGAMADASMSSSESVFEFDDIPVQCGEARGIAAATGRLVESPDANLTATPGAPSALLRLPTDAGGSVLPPASLPVAGPRYAWRVGMIWSLGEGVSADYNQATLWFVEALRRQNALSDFSSQVDIRTALREMSDNSIAHLWREGQKYGGSGDWKLGRFYLGRAALLGDTQSMAALGYSYGDEGTKQPGLEKYWCLKAVAASRQTGNQHERDAVNYFCPARIVNSALTAQERRDNQKSIDRGERKAAEYKAEMEANARFAKAFLESAFDRGHAVEPQMENVYDKNTGGFVRTQIQGGGIDTARETN